MLELLLLVAVAAGVYLRIEALNDKARTRGGKELSFTNPFHWFRAILGLGAYGVGYSPEAIKYVTKEVKGAYQRSKAEMVRSRVEDEIHTRTMTKAGRTRSIINHRPRIEFLDEEFDTLAKEIADIKSATTK